ncbi:helix-turn-helix transcriptional regulator [Paenibacillus agricola]|uniref:PadR family transcriptional regulator n=1 Tax=Paenibacillus agricola TaxID=2716264 RepID=A0ABX0JD40_9BACL|nr:helix-turn-helix transcriptional regulator [Paenibacillus agricola]NHN33169.1 PadR family transcriptional regulator [Paenibacillus agricola]
MRNTNPEEKLETLGSVVKVQQVIDFMVLGVLQQQGKQYNNQMEQFILRKLEGTGVNNAYLTTRLQFLFDNGHVNRWWDTDKRFNRYYSITDSGITYFLQMQHELPGRVEKALKVYHQFDAYIREFDSH